MKKQTVHVYLEIKNGQPLVIVGGTNENTTTENLLNYLKHGVKSESIKACTPTIENGYTNYKFKVYNRDNNLNNYFVVRVRNRERYLHKETIEQIKDIADISNLIKKVNFYRFVAGISASIVLLTMAGPAIAKGIKKLDKMDYEYDQSRYRNYSVTSTVTEEEKQQSIEEYYKDLQQRAQAGDQEAIKEYSIYLAEQQLEEQKNLQDEEKGYTR